MKYRIRVRADGQASVHVYSDFESKMRVGWPCYRTHFRTEALAVQWVRDRITKEKELQKASEIVNEYWFDCSS